MVHLPELEPCPYLPEVASPLRATTMRELGSDRGPAFYFRALECAQSLWRQGLPAQSILLLNRAFAAALDGSEPVLAEWPLPYRPMRWIMDHRREEHFIGNPRRHFQHLATRMVEPRKEQRSWRAWACWRIACDVFPDYPADEVQLATEDVREPTKEEIAEGLMRFGLPGEVGVWREVWG